MKEEWECPSWGYLESTLHLWINGNAKQKKKWKDDLRIITSGLNWDSASQSTKIICSMLRMEISIQLYGS